MRIFTCLIDRWTEPNLVTPEQLSCIDAPASAQALLEERQRRSRLRDSLLGEYTRCTDRRDATLRHIGALAGGAIAIASLFWLSWHWALLIGLFAALLVYAVLGFTTSRCWGIRYEFGGREITPAELKSRLDAYTAELEPLSTDDELQRLEVLVHETPRAQCYLQRLFQQSRALTREELATLEARWQSPASAQTN